MTIATRTAVSLCLALLLALPGAALAGGGDHDFAAEAKRKMNLSFDLDEVEGMLANPAPAMQQQLGALGYADSYGYGYGYGYQMGSYAGQTLPLEPNSDTESVTVYRDRALVTRVLEAELRAGTNSVTFEGLPLGLASDSLHAFVRDEQARIVGAELVSGHGDVEETERIAEIREQMLEITEELGQVRDRIESLLAQRAYLRETLLTGGEEGSPQPSLDQIRGTLSFLGDAERDIAAELRKEQERAKELDEELQPLLIKLENPLATGMTVRVDVDAARGGEATVGLRYQVYGARWRPAYNARLEEQTGHVTLEYFGLVSQETGEDWQGVELLLSTANPSVSGELPQLASWYLGRETYGWDYDVQGNLMAGRGYYQTPDNEMQANPQTVMPQQSVVSSDMSASVQGAGAVVFAIPGERTIAGDGSEQRLPVGNQTFAVGMERTAVPKLVPEVYRQARLQYEGEAPLLPGGVSTFVGGDFVGSGQLKTVVPGEELLLSLGTDDQLQIERQLIARQQDYVGPGKKTTRWTFHFRIKVQNFSEQTQVVRVVDQVPVSEMDKVVVKMLESTEAMPPNPDDGPGILKWRLEVPPGGERVVDLRYSVTAPSEVYLASMMF